MSFDPGLLVLVSIIYLLALFLCAWATDKEIIPEKIVQHPAIYVLSLGIFASSWAYYGSVGIAYDDGYVFLAFYFGLSGAFLLAPVLLSPILRITSSYQLSSLPDLFAFRFRSPTMGIVSTLLLLVISLPLVALQIQAVSSSIHLLSNDGSPKQFAFIFCALIALFTMLFGTRKIAQRKKNHGLVFAIAFESLLKLIVMTVLGFVVLFQIFDSPQGLNQWLEETPEVIIGMNSRLEGGPWRTTLLMFFASAIVMPHMFHMTFSENRNPQHLNIASWGLPLFLLFLSLSTPLILWAGIKTSSSMPAEFFALSIGPALNKPWLTLLAYIGGLSAATGLTVVTTLALSSMVMNHIVLPALQPLFQRKKPGAEQINIYHWLTMIRRILVAVLILSSYGFYQLMDESINLYNPGILAYVGALQLLPATLSSLYWKQSNRYGAICGIGAGTFIWFVTLMLPLALDIHIFSFATKEHWHLAAAGSLAINSLVFVFVSKFTNMTDEEKSAAEACLVKPAGEQLRRAPLASSAHEFLAALEKPLGKTVARTELTRALNDLDMRRGENRPLALRRLRDRIETNLSGLMGPTIAHDIVQTHLPLNTSSTNTSKDIFFIESKLESYRSRLTGLAVKLDELRRYHRQTLNRLPLALCAVDNTSCNNEIMLWNQVMSQMTGIHPDNVVGMPLNRIPSPWNQLLETFFKSDNAHLNKHRIEIDGVCRYFNLHKAYIDTPDSVTGANQVMLLEDLTENKMLEEQLVHSERLASIGQLAAGVAHEIGNPVTGIDCLAQELTLYSDDKDTRKAALQIREQTRRVTAIVQSLVSYAHSGKHGQTIQNPPVTASPVNIRDCVEQAMKLLRLSHKNDHVDFQNYCSPDHNVSGNEQKLQQVCLNLLKNAADASSSDSGAPRVIKVASARETNQVRIYFDDEGTGIPKHLQEKLFDPFFTTKDAGKGTGLGLALTWSIIEEHYGSIKVFSPLYPENPKTQQGTRFIISLPATMTDISGVIQKTTSNAFQDQEIQGEAV